MKEQKEKVKEREMDISDQRKRFKSKLQGIADENKTLKQEAAGAQQQLQTHQQQQDDLREDLDTKEAQVSQTLRQLDAAHRSINTLESQLADMTARVETLTSKQASTSEKLKETHKNHSLQMLKGEQKYQLQMKKKEEERSSLEDAISELTTRMEETKHELFDASQEIHDMKLDNEEQAQLIDALQYRIVDKDKSLETLTQINDELMEQLVHLKKTNVSLSNKYDAIDAKMRGNSVSINEKEIRIKALEADNHRLGVKNMELKGKNSDVVARLSKAQSSVQFLEAVKQRLSAEITSMKQRFGRDEETNIKLIEELTEAKYNLSETLAQDRRELDTLHIKYNNLRRSKVMTAADTQEVNNQLNTKLDEMAALAQKVKVSERLNAKLTKDKLEAESDLARKTEEVVAIGNKVIKMDAQIDALKEAKSDLEDQVSIHTHMHIDMCALSAWCMVWCCTMCAVAVIRHVHIYLSMHAHAGDPNLILHTYFRNETRNYTHTQIHT